MAQNFWSITERAGTGPEAKQNRFAICKETGRFVEEGGSSVKDNGWSIKDAFVEVFLPQGYPESVSEDYLEYQLWDTLQAFASSIVGGLATQAILRGAGVGDESATVMAATLTWLLKDGFGMVGRICFAWLRGTELDSNCKKWRLFADILNDFAFVLDLTAPYFKAMLTPLLCVSSLCRSIVGVAGGATRAALTQHQARRNNLADVSAKDGSQETLVNLAALICNLILLPQLKENIPVTWCLFWMLTAVHLFANYKAVRSVRFDSFNLARFQIVIKEFAATSNVLSVREANEKEPILEALVPPFFATTRRLPNLHLGKSLKETQRQKSTAFGKSLLEGLESMKQSQESTLIVHEPAEEVSSSKDIWIFASGSATPLDLHKAVFLAIYTNETGRTVSPHIWPLFLKAARAAEWNFEISQLGFNEWKISC